MSPFTTRHAAAALALSAIVSLSAIACQGRAGQTAPEAAPNVGPSATAIPDPVADPAVRAILANVQAARSQHDARALHQFRAALTNLLGEAVIERADAAYRQVLVNLRAADAAHDLKARAAFRAQLRALCAPTSVTGAIEPCPDAAPSGS